MSHLVQRRTKRWLGLKKILEMKRLACWSTTNYNLRTLNSTMYVFYIISKSFYFMEGLFQRDLVYSLK